MPKYNKVLYDSRILEYNKKDRRTVFFPPKEYMRRYSISDGGKSGDPDMTQ